MNIESVPIKSLTLDPQNARKHSKRNIDAIAASLQAFGQRRPLVVWEGLVIAGNGTLEAAKSVGWDTVEITRVPSEWTREMARAYAIADNRTAELATWDTDILIPTLAELEESGMFDWTGFTREELDAWGESAADGVDPLDPETGDRNTVGQGDLLAVASVSIDEPLHKVDRHEVWMLSMPDSDVAHVLLVCEVMKEWPMWMDYLKGDAIFVPYPDPYVTHVTTAHERPLVLVQPDEYLAGHVLDKHAAAYGDAHVKRAP